MQNSGLQQGFRQEMNQGFTNQNQGFIQQNQGFRQQQGNNFGNDSVFNNSHHSGPRIKNKGFTVFENNTPHTHQLG